jgi:hypothetical protein
MMSLDEVEECYRLFAAYRTSREIGPFEKALAFLLTQLRRIFKETPSLIVPAPQAIAWYRGGSDDADA